MMTDLNDVSKQNQEVKGISSAPLIGTFMLLILSVLVVGIPWGSTLNDNEGQKVLKGAEIVGLQLIQLYHEAAKDAEHAVKMGKSTRNIASVGESSMDLGKANLNLLQLRLVGSMGTDPYGQAFHYRILDADKSKIKIVVWSSGPNLKAESSDIDNEDMKLDKVEFKGDDVGLVLSDGIRSL